MVGERAEMRVLRRPERARGAWERSEIVLCLSLPYRFIVKPQFFISYVSNFPKSFLDQSPVYKYSHTIIPCLAAGLVTAA